MLKIMLVAAPLLGGGVWLAGGLNALTGAAAAHKERQAVCNEIVDRAVDDHRNSFSGPRLASAETAALDSEAWSQAVQAEIKEAGCDEGRAAVRFIKGAVDMAGESAEHLSAGLPDDDAQGIAPEPVVTE